ncbi:hypothetical protein [Arenimonas sp.]|uniref:hypothetical protein n=1 Tax=Arenimonas sp. TaxID=1872635 RepID=UPI0039E709EC
MPGSRTIVSWLLAFVLLAACARHADAPPAAAVDTAPPAVPVEPAKPAAPSDAIGVACESDADCAVKDVGSCCGYYPRCVNKDSATHPEQVQAQCAKEGRTGVCGFAEVRGCRCENNECVNDTGGGVPPAN